VFRNRNLTTQKTISSLFWKAAQRRLIVIYRRFGTEVFLDWLIPTDLPLIVGNIIEQRRSHLHQEGSPELRVA
jgi:hypothetical protein